MKEKVRKTIKKVLSLFPTALPQSDATFVSWSEEVLQLANLPVNDSFRHALATQVMHLGSHVSHASKAHFIKGLKAAVSKQCAFNVIELVREAEKAKKAAV